MNAWRLRLDKVRKPLQFEGSLPQAFASQQLLSPTLMSPRLLPSLITVIALVPDASRAETIESGSITAEVERLKVLAFIEDSDSYVAPDSNQIANFASMAAAVYHGNLAAADALAAELGYEVVRFTDNTSNNEYYLLRENLAGGLQTRGWGTYAIHSNPTTRALVEIPHPLHDTHTWRIGGSVFNDSNATGLLMAGAHRHANGHNTADVAHLDASIFQTIHETWTALDTGLVAFSIHGFDIDNHGAFPPGTDFVISNGTGDVSGEVIALDAAFDNAGYTSYVYNTLAVDDPLNVQVNGTYVGTTFNGLGATTTEQQLHSTSVGATFVHIEIGRPLRFDASQREIVADLISNIIISETAIPEPANYGMLSGAAALLSGLRRRRNATVTRTGT